MMKEMKVSEDTAALAVIVSAVEKLAVEDNFAIVLDGSSIFMKAKVLHMVTHIILKNEKIRRMLKMQRKLERKSNDSKMTFSDAYEKIADHAARGGRLHVL